MIQFSWRKAANFIINCGSPGHHLYTFLQMFQIPFTCSFPLFQKNPENCLCQSQMLEFCVEVGFFRPNQFGLKVWWKHTEWWNNISSQSLSIARQLESQQLDATQTGRPHNFCLHSCNTRYRSVQEVQWQTREFNDPSLLDAWLEESCKQ